MALITANDLEVMDGVITWPRTGAWHMRIRLDEKDPTKFSGAITVQIAGRLTMKGTAVPGFVGEFLHTGYVRIVAGAGKLSTPTEAKDFQNPTLRIILDHLLKNRETLSSSSSAAALNRRVPYWVVMGGWGTGPALTYLVENVAPASSWRFLANGELWVGEETWPEVKESYELEALQPDQAGATLAVDAPLIQPGTTLEGRHVGEVVHTIGPGKVRTAVAFE